MPPAISTARPPVAALTINGTVFELTPTVGGGWTEKVLHNFGYRQSRGRVVARRRPDLRCCRQSLRYDLLRRHLSKRGINSKRLRDGVRVDARRGGSWTEKMLHSFASTARTGLIPTPA